MRRSEPRALHKNKPLQICTVGTVNWKFAVEFYVQVSSNEKKHNTHHDKMYNDEHTSHTYLCSITCFIIVPVGTSSWFPNTKAN